MAEAAPTELVTITINEQEIQVPKGEMIVESVKRLGLEIPIFCYHPRMEPVGMCRMCLVEVGWKQDDGSARMMPKPQAGCTLPASDGMVVITDSEALHKDRKGVLEFLLINHPLDCPICDRGGECPLQNNTLAYGPSTSRFTEMKRHLPKAYPLSEYVTLDLERCIQCGRCVRFTEEISGDHDLAFRFRGAEMQPATFKLTDFESKFSGNVIEICPVGALTSTRYRFRARPWDLETAPGLCTVTPCGTNVWFDHRAGKFVRLNGRTNEAVNEEWTCDRTKFGHDFYNAPDRLKAPHVRTDEGFVAQGWAEAYQPILEHFSGSGSDAGMILGPSMANEDMWMAKQLMEEGFGSASLDHRLSGSIASVGFDPVGLTIAELEGKDEIVIFGTSLADEEPMTYLRVRKAAVKHGAKVHVIHTGPTDADRFAAKVTHTSDLAGAARDLAASGSLGENSAIIAARSLLDQPNGEEAARILSETGKPFSLMATQSNEQGALDLGILPGSGGRSTRQMLEAARDGQLKALWLVNCDPLTEFPDRALAEAALENVPFLIVQHWRETEAASYASVILPMTLPAEQDGTFTNVERRVQRMGHILTPPGESKPSWRIFTEALLRASDKASPAFNTKEIMDRIGQAHPQWKGAAYENLAGEGALLRPEIAPVEAA